MSQYKKRRLLPQPPSSPRYVACPICSSQMPAYHVSSHIDTHHADACSTARTAHPGSTSSAANPSRQPPPASTTDMPRQSPRQPAVKAAPAPAALPQPSATPAGAPAAVPGSPCPDSTTWWRTSDPVVAHVRYAGFPKQQHPIRLSELPALGPFELFLKFLPGDLASGLLAALLQDSVQWTSGTRWFGGQPQKEPRLVARYMLQSTLAPQGDGSGSAIFGAAEAPGSRQESHGEQQQHGHHHYQQQEEEQEGQLQRQQPWQGQHQEEQEQQLQQSAQHRSGNSYAAELAAGKLLQEAADLVNAAVSSRIGNHVTVDAAGRPLGGSPACSSSSSASASAPTDRPEAGVSNSGLSVGAAGMRPAPPHWRSSYVMANLYRDGQDAVAAHADRLTGLGPRPVIASLSLGAARTFRVRPVETERGEQPGLQREQQQLGEEGVASCEEDVEVQRNGQQQQQQQRRITSIDIVLPHNSLLIMGPPAQEAWKHEVPRTKAVQAHSLSGPARVNLTFRQHKAEWEARAPHCKCGRTAVLKALMPRTKSTSSNRAAGGQEPGWLLGHRYLYACDNTQGDPCNFFKWLQL